MRNILTIIVLMILVGCGQADKSEESDKCGGQGSALVGKWQTFCADKGYVETLEFNGSNYIDHTVFYNHSDCSGPFLEESTEDGTYSLQGVSQDGFCFVNRRNSVKQYVNEFTINESFLLMKTTNWKYIKVSK